MKRIFLTACTLFLMLGMVLRAQSSEPLTLSYGNGVSRIEIYPDGYKLGSDAPSVPYTGAYVITGSSGGDALIINNESRVKQTFDITFRDLTIESGQWEGAVAISSQTSADTIVLNLYSSGTCLVRSGNHTALASRGNTEAPRIINLSVLDGTLTLETQHEAGGGFAWSSDYNTTFNLVNTLTIDGASSFTNSEQGSVTLKSNFLYTSNNDGTHQKTLAGNSVTEDCSYRYEPVEGAEQHKGICIHCGYQIEPEPCTPSDEWVVKDDQYHGKTCSICGQIVSPELHADLDNDHKCDYCGMVILAEPDRTAEGVYQISNMAELYWFAALVNGTLDTVPQETEADAVLTADIVINENVLTAEGELVEDTDGLMAWTPMGSESAPFNGTFDGQGHTISGLYINQPKADEQGLFGYVGSSGNVSRIEVTGSYIHGQDGVGGITGINNGLLTACSYSGTVIGNNYPLGGVAGGNDGTVSCCYATGKVHATGSDPYVGGVVGDNYGTIFSCYSTALLSTDDSGPIGGVASYNADGHITDSYYLQGSADKGVDENGGTVENVESRTAEQFASGEVTWLLQHAITDDTQIWGQNLLADTLPVLLSEHKVYAALFIHETTGLQMMGKYGNQNAQIPLPTAEELGANGEVSFSDMLGNPLTETITLLSDTVILVNCRLYSITVSNNILNGDISVPYDSYNVGAEVTVEAIPYSGYEPLCLYVQTYDGQEYEYEDFSFTMPAADVVLSADFIPYLYGATYTISEDDNGYNVMLTWGYDASDCHTLIYRDGNLLHTTEVNETSWQEQISEAGAYNYTIYVVNAQGVRSRGTLLTVYAYPSTPMGTSGTQSIDLGDVPELFTDDGGRNGNYSNDVDVTTEITAQEDCRIYLTGNYVLEQGFDYLQIYDSDNSRLIECNGMGTIEPALLSSGNTLSVRFTSDGSNTHEGFELYVETVYPVTIAEVENGTVESDTAWARAGGIVTLTPLPNEQYAYVEGSLKVLKADDPTVEVPVNADGSFTMPAFKINVTATFGNSTALSVTENNTLRVFGTDGMLHITGTEAEAEVYDVRGVLVYRGIGRNLYLPTGVYIVRAEGQVQKAIVK